MANFGHESSQDPFGSPFGGEFYILGPNELTELGIDLTGILRALTQSLHVQRDPYSIAERERETYLATKALGDFIVQENIADVVFVDASARPVRAGLSEYMDLARQPKPDMHFINPRRFDVGDKGLLFGAAAKAVRHIGGRRELQQTNNTLLTHKNDPVLVFDACMHSGETALGVRDFLDSMNFSDVRLGAFSVGSNYGTQCRTEVDFVYTNNPELLYCRPFGLDVELGKNNHSVYSQPPTTVRGTQQLAHNREMARALVREQHQLHNQ